MPDVQTAESNPQPTTPIIVDYRGFVGAAEGQPPIPHTGSARIFWWPQDGLEELILSPGCNVITDRALWETYSTKESGLKAALAAGWVKVLDGLPPVFELTNVENGLISRTRSQVGLDWIEAQEQEGQRRKLVLETIAQRRPRARPLMFEPKPYASHQTFDDALAAKGGRKPVEATASM